MGSKDAALSVWAVTGLLSLFGALSFAELAAMMPQAGGQYVYLREAYGPLVGYSVRLVLLHRRANRWHFGAGSGLCRIHQ